jgi:hypothetical protein
MIYLFAGVSARRLSMFVRNVGQLCSIDDRFFGADISRPTEYRETLADLLERLTSVEKKALLSALFAASRQTGACCRRDHRAQA